MTSFMVVRDRLRKFIQAHEIGVTRTAHGILTFIGLLTIMSTFPYAEGLNHIWILLPLTVAGAFMPISAVGLLLTVFLLINLASLSMPIAGIATVFFAISYMFCGVYQAKKVHLLVGGVIARQLSIPFVIPVQAALLGTAGEVVTVICTSFISFFLHEVYNNVNIFMDSESNMNIVDFIQEKIIGNQIFYVYILAMVSLFLAVYIIRTRNIQHAWVWSVLGGVSIEFIIMLAGYLFIGNKGGILMSVFANVFTLVVGLATSYLYQDLDYTRIEKVQFEDDDYYYYVTAVPKISLTEEEVSIKHINPTDTGGQ